MNTTPCLQHLSEADLDDLIADLKQRGTHELILWRPRWHLGVNTDKLPGKLDPAVSVYQLVEDDPYLAQRLSSLNQLTSLSLKGNKIGDAGASSLVALTQLKSLNLEGNQIGATGAAYLAELSQLTSLSLAMNNIGSTGAAAIAALDNLTWLDLVCCPRNTQA
jgi:Leucine-rich repeat (LRR) protein